MISAVGTALFLTAAVFCGIIHAFTGTGGRGGAAPDSDYRMKRLLRKLTDHSPGRKIDGLLKEAGYPFGIGIGAYAVMLSLACLAAVFLSLRTGGGQGIRLLVIALGGLHVPLYCKARERRQKLQLQLCGIQDIMYFQSSIGTPLDAILAYAAKASDEPLKTPLYSLAERYRISGDMGKCLEDFRKTSGLLELQAFTFILEQREKTGFSAENHRAQASMLKRSKRMRRRLMRSYKRAKLMVASVLMFGCYVLFVTVPIIKVIANSLDLIFR